jgi:hypothetical protein
MPDSKKPKPENIPDMTLPERSKTPPAAGQNTDNVTPPTPPSGKAPAPWDKPVSAGGWKVGDRVLAPWEPMFCYVGTIQEINKHKAMIQFDDGDAGWVAVDQLRSLSVECGQKVSSRRKMGPLFFPGEILRIRGDEVLVGFEDGSDEWTRIAAVRFPREEDDDSQGAEPTKVASNQVFLESLRKGHRVWAPWNAGVHFVGTVDKIRDGEAHIEFDDGDQGWVQLDQLLPFEPRVGMRILGNWRMAGNYYAGVVTKVAGDRLHIRYDDGHEEWTKAAALALPGMSAGPNARPTKTVTHGASSARRLLWLAPIGIGLLLLFLRFGCR